ncbi:ribosomal protein S18 acetylase RimI-like enzyme [Prauserella isguenensis]|uniref:Ribosomal protein S18 acetylase RimI-like enzyme n=1 Tax=Prauserella isguenensis TaxID=1470180 RepID=A0A839S5T6_9PSEU|nr:GNAT family N-acetyltransferase [Prauserella isguenensis]MBB3052370.1 ribosomal protein S18 acetylase RimI-like enzyme [Prauserella isguenensis]
MSEVRVRTAKPGEYDAIGELTVEAYTAGGHLADDVGYDASLRDVAGRAVTAEVLVAVDGDDVVLGSVTVAEAGTPKAEVARAGELEFRMLAVSPHAQGRGVGEVLTRAVVDLARERRIVRVVLSSRDRMTAAHRLYERLGFTRAPELDWEPHPGIPLWGFAMDV